MFTATASGSSIMIITLVSPYSWFISQEPTTKLVVYVGQALKLTSDGPNPEASAFSIPYSQLSGSGPALNIISSTEATIDYTQGGMIHNPSGLPSNNIFYSSTGESFAFILIFTFFN